MVSTSGRRPVSVLREIKRNGMTNGTLTTRLRGRREREQSIHMYMYTIVKYYIILCILIHVTVLY